MPWSLTAFSTPQQILPVLLICGAPSLFQSFLHWQWLCVHINSDFCSQGMGHNSAGKSEVKKVLGTSVFSALGSVLPGAVAVSWKGCLLHLGSPWLWNPSVTPSTTQPQAVPCPPSAPSSDLCDFPLPNNENTSFSCFQLAYWLYLMKWNYSVLQNLNIWIYEGGENEQVLGMQIILCGCSDKKYKYFLSSKMS